MEIHQRSGFPEVRQQQDSDRGGLGNFVRKEIRGPSLHHSPHTSQFAVSVYMWSVLHQVLSDHYVKVPSFLLDDHGVNVPGFECPHLSI